jgi:SAM-dependent methyltransferase
MSPTTTTILPPSFRVTEMMLSLWVPQAVHAAAALGLADVLARGARNCEELAWELGVDAGALRRLLRGLVLLELCAETKTGAYELTPNGECLRSDGPDSVRAWALLMGGEVGWRPWGRLLECVRTGKNVWHLDGTDPFTWMREHPDVAETFNEAMRQVSRRTAAAVARGYDFSRASRIVDVGGGYGTLVAAILKEFSGVRATVFDLPHCRDGAERLFEEAGVRDRAEFAAGDFFESVPEGGDVYLIKSVIHDWDDEKSVVILRNCTEAMGGRGTLLLVEPFAPERVGESPFDNVVVASDLNMLVQTGGKERTESEYRALLDSAGLGVTGIRSTPSSMRIVEAKPLPRRASKE